MPLPDGYEQKFPAGSGYFADVIICVSVASQSEVALKRLQQRHAGNEGYRRRFEREIRITRDLAGLDGVVPILDNGIVDGVPYFTMPRAASNLLDYLRRDQPDLTAQQRASICLSILEAMAKAHARGILHRDISPHNVLVFIENDEPVFRISDFGLGKTKEELETLTTSSHAGYGALLYVAPEQRERLTSASTRSDVFSLGRLIDFVMTSCDPDNVTHHEFRPVCRRACSQDPEERYRDASALLEAFNLQHDLAFGRTTGEFVAFQELEQASDNINWHSIHRLLTAGTYSGNAYQGYLDPVISFFEDDQNRLQEYASANGVVIDEFAQRLCTEVEAAAGQVGWPFNQTNRFYRILSQIIPFLRTTEAKLACCQMLWDHAYGSDQWAAQDRVKEVLASDAMNSELQIEFAAYIARHPSRYIDDSVATASPPGPVRRAIHAVMLAKRDRS